MFFVLKSVFCMEKVGRNGELGIDIYVLLMLGRK